MISLIRVALLTSTVSLLLFCAVVAVGGALDDLSDDVDLTVSFLYLNKTTTSYENNDIGIVFEIINQGNKSVKNPRMSCLEIDGNEVTEFYDDKTLKPGETRIYHYVYEQGSNTSSSHVIKALVDCDDDVPENNESNNFKMECVYIKSIDMHVFADSPEVAEYVESTFKGDSSLNITSKIIEFSQRWTYIIIKEVSKKDLNNYSVLVPLNPSNYPDKLCQNGSDIRFLDENGQALNYWIEEFDNISKTAKVWVKVPYIPASGETRIEMRYGNQSASSESDGDAVFDLFDDFEDGSIDPNKWTYNSPTIEEKDHELHIRASNTSWTAADLIALKSYRPNVAMKFRTNNSEGHANDCKGLGFMSTNVYGPSSDEVNRVGPSVYWRVNEEKIFTRHNYPTIDSDVSNNYGVRVNPNYVPGHQIWEIIWSEDQINYILNDELKQTHTDTGIPSMSITPRFSLNTTYIATDPAQSEISVDWVFVRNCTYPEPTVQIINT